MVAESLTALDHCRAMSSSDQSQSQANWLEAAQVYFQPRVLIVILLGFSAGLPLALSGSTLLIWMTDRGIDLGTIGLYSLVGLPYVFKFIWAPVIDAWRVPVLCRWLGRRRGWLIATQLALMAAIVFLGSLDPELNPWLVALAAIFVSTSSATQDIVIDAFRVESLEDNEQAAGLAGYVAAYRIALLVSTAGVIALAGWLEMSGVAKDVVWFWSYGAAAAMIGVGMIAVLLAREPDMPTASEQAMPQNSVGRLAATAVTAFTDFLTKPYAIAILLLVLLFKFGDAFAGVMTGPFVIKLGFEKAAYAGIVKGVGTIAVLAGGFRRRFYCPRPAPYHGIVDRRHPATGLEPGVLMASNSWCRSFSTCCRHRR